MTNVKIVIGGNFGDEGKGLMTAYFAEQMMSRSGKCLTILSNGGAQRGHTVVRDSVRHVFRHLGSGTFAGADTYFPRDFIVNPMIFMKEYRELRQAAPGQCSRVRIFIHPECMITTPYEMIANLILEESRGENRHGSVGVGIWETVIGSGIRYDKLAGMNLPEQTDYLLDDRRAHLYERLRSQGISSVPSAWKDIIEDPALARNYLTDLQEMKNRVVLSDDRLLLSYPELIFENGQGLLLDRGMLRKGYGHHTTPSNTGMHNPAAILRNVYKGKQPEPETEAVYVTRSYMTRHGAGRFDTECPVSMINPAIRDLTNQPNPSQGSLRFGRLNMRSFLRRAKRDFEAATAADENGRAFPGKVSWSAAMTHLNEFAPPSCGRRHVRYESYAETGETCVILKEQQ